MKKLQPFELPSIYLHAVGNYNAETKREISLHTLLTIRKSILPISTPSAIRISGGGSSREPEIIKFEYFQLTEKEQKFYDAELKKRRFDLLEITESILSQRNSSVSSVGVEEFVRNVKRIQDWKEVQLFITLGREKYLLRKNSDSFLKLLDTEASLFERKNNLKSEKVTANIFDQRQSWVDAIKGKLIEWFVDNGYEVPNIEIIKVELFEAAKACKKLIGKNRNKKPTEICKAYLFTHQIIGKAGYTGEKLYNYIIKMRDKF